MERVLVPHGALSISDPICETYITDKLRLDERLRAMCLSRAIPLDDYVGHVTDVGFGTVCDARCTSGCV